MLDFWVWYWHWYLLQYIGRLQKTQDNLATDILDLFFKELG